MLGSTELVVYGQQPAFPKFLILHSTPLTSPLLSPFLTLGGSQPLHRSWTLLLLGRQEACLRRLEYAPPPYPPSLLPLTHSITPPSLLHSPPRSFPASLCPHGPRHCLARAGCLRHLLLDEEQHFMEWRCLQQPKQSR